MSHSDRPNPETILLDNGELAATPADVFLAFDKLGIEHQTQIHEALYTVEQAKTVVYADPGVC